MGWFVCDRGWHLTCAIFFFSSRRRHTRYIGDWSSDVCSSDLEGDEHLAELRLPLARVPEPQGVLVGGIERSEERRVGKSVDLGGRRVMTKKKRCRWRQRACSQRH